MKAWYLLGFDFSKRVAEAANARFTRGLFGAGAGDPMNNPIWQNACFAIIRDLGFVPGHDGVYESWESLVEDGFWSRGGGKVWRGKPYPPVNQ